jgi:SAM-dependent methyltransferase
MEFRDIVTISQGGLPIMNPTTPEKLLRIGRAAGLGPGSRVIEFGCGNGTILALWAEEFGISGTGIEVREAACRQARQMLASRGLESAVRILPMDGRTYRHDDEPCDLAACLGASFIWGGIGPALDAIAETVHHRGRILIADRYWKTERIPPEFAREWPEIPTEYELLGMIRERGFSLGSVIRASEDDWDSYESGIWQSCLTWLADNPAHPDRQEVEEYLRSIQDEYLAFGREYLGWAMYLLVPAPAEDGRDSP